jgi:hypothetical protein
VLNVFHPKWDMTFNKRECHMKRQCCIFFIPQPLFRLTALATISLSNHYLFGYPQHKHITWFGRIGWNSRWWKCANHSATVWLRPEATTRILDDVSVQTMPLHWGWGCRTFQSASHIHGIHMWGVWAPSTAVDGYMAAHPCHYHHSHFSWFRRESQHPRWCKCANHATTLWLRLLKS